MRVITRRTGGVSESHDIDGQILPDGRNCQSLRADELLRELKSLRVPVESYMGHQDLVWCYAVYRSAHPLPQPVDHREPVHAAAVSSVAGKKKA